MKCLYTAQTLTRFWDTAPETLVYNGLRHLFISAAPVLLTAHRKKLSERAHSNYSVFQSSMKNYKLRARQNKLRLKTLVPRGAGRDLRGSLQLTQHWRAFQREWRTKAHTHTQPTQTMARTLGDATTAHQDSLPYPPPPTRGAGHWF